MVAVMEAPTVAPEGNAADTREQKKNNTYGWVIISLFVVTMLPGTIASAAACRISAVSATVAATVRSLFATVFIGGCCLLGSGMCLCPFSREIIQKNNHGSAWIA